MHRFTRLYVGGNSKDKLEINFCYIVSHFVPEIFLSCLMCTTINVTLQGKLSVHECMFICVYVFYSRTPVERRSVLAWWQWSSRLPNPEEPDSWPKVASWTTRSVVDPRKLPRLLRRKTRRIRARWICCTPRLFLQHPLRVRGHTHRDRICNPYQRK